MSDGRDSGGGQPRSSKRLGYSSLGIHGFLPQNVGFYKAMSPLHASLHPSSGCGKQKTLLEMRSFKGLLWGWGFDPHETFCPLPNSFIMGLRPRHTPWSLLRHERPTSSWGWEMGVPGLGKAEQYRRTFSRQEASCCHRAVSAPPFILCSDFPLHKVGTEASCDWKGKRMFLKHLWDTKQTAFPSLIHSLFFQTIVDRHLWCAKHNGEIFKITNQGAYFPKSHILKGPWPITFPNITQLCLRNTFKWDYPSFPTWRTFRKKHLGQVFLLYK